MIGFAGLEHLGIVSSVAAAAKGCGVVAFDPDDELCQGFANGQSSMVEPGLTELLKSSKDNIKFTSDASLLRDCSVVYVSLDTETDDDGHSDLGPLQDLINRVSSDLSPRTVLVVLSQVPPGFTRELAAKVRVEQPGKDLKVLCQVETLVIGQALERAMQPERIMIGSSDSNADLPPAINEFLENFDCPVMHMGYESAELTKIAINMFLTSSVATTNTLAELCESIGADWSEIAPALKLDRRIGPYAYLAPGLGLSGGHLERDLATVISLSAQHGTDARVVDSWLSNSRRRRNWALQMAHSEIVSQIANPTIAMWGLAYKPGTSITKNSPAIYLMNALFSCGLQVYDPEAVLNGDGPASAVQTASALDACRGADGLVIATAWDEFSSIDLAQVREVMTKPVVIDPLGVISAERCAQVGLSHFRLGSPVPKQETSR